MNSLTGHAYWLEKPLFFLDFLRSDNPLFFLRFSARRVLQDVYTDTFHFPSYLWISWMSLILYEKWRTYSTFYSKHFWPLLAQGTWCFMKKTILTNKAMHFICIVVRNSESKTFHPKCMLRSWKLNSRTKYCHELSVRFLLVKMKKKMRKVWQTRTHHGPGVESRRLQVRSSHSSTLRKYWRQGTQEGVIECDVSNS